jgi:hypothetical protein
VDAGALLLAATSRGADNATIELLSKLFREERDDRRRMAFDAAMAEAQSEMQRVAPDASNSQTRSRYATYAALDRRLRPIYTRHGFGLTFNTQPGPGPEWVRVTCRVSHRGGWGQDFGIDMPADGKGAKGGDVMTKTHAVGSATSYGMRYLLRLVFNIAVGDDDGNAASGGRARATITEQEAANLRELCEACGRPVESLLTFAGVGDLSQYPASAYEGVCRQLKVAADRAQRGN